MIRWFALQQGRVVEASEGLGQVLLVNDPTAQEKDILVTQFGIDAHNLASALDPDELPRMEIETDHLAVIFKHPKNYSAADNFVFRMNSLGLFLGKDRLIIVAPSDVVLFNGRQFTKMQNLSALFLRILSVCVNHFIGHLHIISNIADEIESKIMTEMGNSGLMLMFSVEKSLVYYINAISANGGVIERLKANARNAQSEGLSPADAEFVDDLAIENAQCLQQAKVFGDVFTGLMDARASIVNNNLNVLMKRLTVITVVFAPINVIAGIGGMSEFSMMTEKIPWPVAYGIFMLGMCGIGAATYYVLRHFERSSFRR